ncbi:MAG: group II intron maturase-specific domain-containing protein [Segetibacter sp.]
MAERIAKLKEVGRGWLNYFRMASITGKLKNLDSWIRWQAALLHMARLEEA